MPAMTPCSSQPRGRSEGVSELQPKIRAPSTPLQVYRGSHLQWAREAPPSAAAGTSGGGGGATSRSGTFVVGSAVIARSPLVGRSADRCDDARDERELFLLPVADDEADPFGNLLPGTPQPAEGLGDDEPGLVRQPVQKGVVRILRAQRRDVGAVEQGAGAPLAGVPERPQGLSVS